ncbi:MAG: methylated-DNA--[protein]-cysteine S-methyltransferase [Candidatus Bathyarchaeota archaeon]|nr:methylated-DNA--[protein]-cysteine S-methyltransferase [Candidatus Bathyarchaeota archaeon]
MGLYAKKFGAVWAGVACDEPRVFGTSFADSQEEALKCLLAGVPFNVPFQIFPEPSKFAESVLLTVKNIFDGKDISYSFQLAMEHLSVYTRRVLEATASIPIGYVASYGAVAETVGGSPRAVGNVMAANPFAPIVPCHRVVGAGFTLGGYGGGLALKREMLSRERRGFVDSKLISVGGSARKLQVFPVERVLQKIGKT